VKRSKARVFVSVRIVRFANYSSTDSEFTVRRAELCVGLMKGVRQNITKFNRLLGESRLSRLSAFYLIFNRTCIRTYVLTSHSQSAVLGPILGQLFESGSPKLVLLISTSYPVYIPFLQLGAFQDTYETKQSTHLFSPSELFCYFVLKPLCA
jgi:hypothetical protein